MPTQTRSSVFETNSSSTHSISIAYSNSPDDLMDILLPDSEGNIVLNGGEFGWSEEYFYDAQTKASYLAVYCAEWCGDRKDEFFAILFDVIKKQTGCNQVILNFTCEYSYSDKDSKNWSYIDHQSAESQDYHYLFDDPEQIRQFVFNPKSVLETGNDNGPYSDEDYDGVEEESTEEDDSDIERETT